MKKLLILLILLSVSCSTLMYSPMNAPPHSTGECIVGVLAPTVDTLIATLLIFTAVSINKDNRDLNKEKLNSAGWIVGGTVMSLSGLYGFGSYSFYCLD